MPQKSGHLTSGEVGDMVEGLLRHVADEWGFYRAHLPHLRRTLMVYNEFAYGIRFLPENRGEDGGVEFNPKDPLIELVPGIFGDQFTEEISNLIYGAWPLRREGKEWEGYEEPIPDDPASLHKAWPGLFRTDEDARIFMYEIPGTGFGDFKGARVKLTAGGTPDIWYQGFTTAEESAAQCKALDVIRLHPRVKLGVKLMDEAYAKAKHRREREEKERGWVRPYFIDWAAALARLQKA